jgi:hypothetical protein
MEEMGFIAGLFVDSERVTALDANRFVGTDHPVHSF